MTGDPKIALHMEIEKALKQQIDILIVEALTAAGYRIVSPGQIDPETRERAAKVAEAEPNFVGDPPDAVVAAMEDAGPVMNARAAGSATKRSIAAAIRSLGDTAK